MHILGADENLLICACMWCGCSGEGGFGWPQDDCQRVSLDFLVYVLLIYFSPRKKFRDTFAFGAPKVIGHYITIWMITYADKVIISGMKSPSCVPSLLYASDLGRHTSVVFIHNDSETNTIQVARYTWEHSTQRPNTHTYPISCPKCHTVQSWCPPDVVQRGDGEKFTLRCLNKIERRGKKVNCSGSYVVDERPPAHLVGSPYVGSWHALNPSE